MTAGRPTFSFHEFDTVDSTNEAAKRMVREGKLTAPAVLLARTQTAGKGQRGRRWYSPPEAGLYMTVVDAPPRPVRPTGPVFTLAAGVACAEVLREAAGVDVRLKPVNDLYVGGRKLGGILTETIVRGDVLQFLVTGVGVNLRRWEPPEPFAAPPTWLEEWIAPSRLAALERRRLAVALAEAVLAWNAVIWEGKEEQVRMAWSRHALGGFEAAGEELHS